MLADQGFVFHWDNAPLHTATVLLESLVRRHHHPEPKTPALFAVSGGGRLHMVPQHKGGPGWAAHCCRRQPQYQLGWGPRNRLQRSVRRRFPVVVRAQ